MNHSKTSFQIRTFVSHKLRMSSAKSPFEILELAIPAYSELHKNYIYVGDH